MFLHRSNSLLYPNPRPVQRAMVNLSVNDSVKSLNVNQRTPKAGQANRGSEIFCDRKPKVKRSKSFTNSPQIKKIAEVRETKAERFKMLLSLLTKDIAIGAK